MRKTIIKRDLFVNMLKVDYGSTCYFDVFFILTIFTDFFPFFLLVKVEQRKSLNLRNKITNISCSRKLVVVTSIDIMLPLCR